MVLRWSKEKVISEIKSIYNSKGDLSARLCSLNRRKLFKAALYYFGSWKKAIEDAEIDYERILKQKQWTKGEVINQIKELYNKGVDISYKNMRKMNYLLVIAAENNFGNYAKAVIATGIDYYNKVAHAKNKYWTKEKIITKIKELNTIGTSLSSQDMQKSKYRDLFDAAKNRFGSWEKAITEAGFDYEKISKLKAQTDSFKRKLRSELTEDKLNQLYVEKGLSTVELAIIYDVSPKVITNLLKKYNIELKKPK